LYYAVPLSWKPATPLQRQKTFPAMFGLNSAQTRQLDRLSATHYPFRLKIARHNLSQLFRFCGLMMLALLSVIVMQIAGLNQNL
jgi:hypothetical protein